MAVRAKRIRDLAEQLLEKNGIDSPPVPIENIIQTFGMELRKQPNANSNISGFISRRGQTVLIGVNSSQTYARQRFTMAHEFGHHLLHPQSSGNIHVDHTFDIRFRDGISSQGTNVDEREANLFAAELLMPKHFIERSVSNLGQFDIDDPEFEKIISRLASQYEVSSQAMLFRLANLNYIEL